MSDSSSSRYVFEATADRFLEEVVERSSKVPVVVDFWAEWCQPCRTLGPTLEKLATEYAGRFVLAKADTAVLGEIASGFGVRSIPAVFGLRDRKVVDQFVGALPESALRAWLDRFLPSAADTLASEAQELEASDPAGAEQKYREALEQSPDSVPARVGLARMALRGDRSDEARAILEGLTRQGYQTAEIDAVQAELSLRSRAASVGQVDPLRAAWKANPADHTGQLALAEALAASGETTEALDLALDLVERDRRQTGEAARKLMIALFQVLPPDSPIVTDYRRRLSFAL